MDRYRISFNNGGMENVEANDFADAGAQAERIAAHATAKLQAVVMVTNVQRIPS